MKEKRGVLSSFVKKKRKDVGITQVELSEKAGVGLQFVRDLEQGKKTLRIDKVNDVLRLWGYELQPAKLGLDELLENMKNA
ncbi:MAG: helix-turn-helix transcriptional regulator [Flavobacteriales bacterium]|nr:helix-turn-helix transcriptional regulator [Flavobacteriales bacterium]